MSEIQKKLNTAEAAEYLGVRPNTLEVWRCKHKGPHYSKIGSHVLYDMADLEAFFHARAVSTLKSPDKAQRRTPKWEEPF